MPRIDMNNIRFAATPSFRHCRRQVTMRCRQLDADTIFSMIFADVTIRHMSADADASACHCRFSPPFFMLFDYAMN